MRQFDTFQSYLDNTGDPLVGRIRFCNIDGSAADVFDLNGNPVSNPLFTDSSGRCSVQVFMEDHDYLVHFEKYVGQAVMVEDVDEESWEHQGSSINRYNTVGVNVDVDGGFQSVETMDDLRRLDPRSNSNFVCLLGYFDAGDKPAVFYKWVDNNTMPHDGGSTISSLVAGVVRGRWIIIPSFSQIDVRHFGAFPSSSRERNAQQRIAIQNAATYGNKLGLSLCFHAEPTLFNYDVSTLDINGVVCAETVRLYNCEAADTKLNNVSTVHVIENKSGKGGKVVVSGDVLKTSFNVENSSNVALIPAKTIILDTDYTLMVNASFKDIECVVVANQTDGIRFENCTFSGSGKLMDETLFVLKNCVVKESMFENYTSKFVTCENCETNINYWQNVDKYVDFMISSGYNSLDLNGRSVRGDVDIAGKDLFFSNGKIEGKVTCKNFKGRNLEVGLVSADSFDIVNCSIGVEGCVGGIKSTNSVIETSEDLWIGSGAEIVNCTIRTNRNAIYIYPELDSTEGARIKDINIRDSRIYGFLEFTPIPYGSDAALNLIRVNGVYITDNVIIERNDKSNYPIVIADGSFEHFSKSQGVYSILNNRKSSGGFFQETKIGDAEFTWDGTLTFATDGEKILPANQLTLSRFVFCFGETGNFVDYAGNSLYIKSIELSWQEYGYSGTLKVEGKEIYITNIDSGMNTISESWLGSEPISPSTGRVPPQSTSVHANVKVSFIRLSKTSKAPYNKFN